MKFSETPLNGAFVIEPDMIEDQRGFFARTFCRKEFARHGLNADIMQCNISFNGKKGVLRGMHYQNKPFEETKLVRCTSGAIYDVIVDMRQDSPSFKNWFGVELNNDNRKMIYIPEGLAHGFLTLSDHSEVFYQMSEIFHPESAAGIRWDDPAVGIDWPMSVALVSERDRSYPDWNPIGWQIT